MIPEIPSASDILSSKNGTTFITLSIPYGVLDHCLSQVIVVTHYA